MEEYSPEERFLLDVEYWWIRLYNRIRRFQNANRRPVLIAVSRKMPRFIEWFRIEGYKKIAHCPDVNILDGIEITTEIAIPFICLNEDATDTPFIILDDLIIHGTSLTITSNLIYALTGQVPLMVCIGMLKSVNVRPKVDDEDFDRTPTLTQDLVDDFSERVSSIVENWMLPVDMEFPVFTIPGKIELSPDRVLDMDRIVFEIKSKLKENFKSRAYLVGDDRKRLTIDLRRRESAGEDTDFSKVRFFIKNKERIIFEVFSPMLLSEFLLLAKTIGPFTHIDHKKDPDRRYERIWNSTTSFIRDNDTFVVPIEKLDVPVSVLRQEISRSLAVWANYLFSLSTYIRNRRVLIPEEVLDQVKLSREDLSMIIGKDGTERIYDQLTDMIADGVYAVSTRMEPVTIPDSICPEKLELQVGAQKIVAVMEGETPENVGEGIFGFLHYTNPKLKDPDMRPADWRKIVVAETYFSLQDALTPFFMEFEHFFKLRAWVDSQIDAGRIVPKYNRVEDKAGRVFWRRFFHAGIRKFPQKTDSPT